MAISFRPTLIDEKGRTIRVFGQVVFSGNYTTGGDSLTNSLPDYVNAPGAGYDTLLLLKQIPADRKLAYANLQFDAGYWAVVVPGTGPWNFKVKIYSANGIELAQAAYPAAISSATQHTLEVEFKKNL